MRAKRRSDACLVIQPRVSGSLPFPPSLPSSSALSDLVLQWPLLRPSRPLFCLKLALRLAVAAVFLVTFTILYR